MLPEGSDAMLDLTK